LHFHDSWSLFLDFVEEFLVVGASGFSKGGVPSGDLASPCTELFFIGEMITNEGGEK
jgi:hypothetical protein